MEGRLIRHVTTCLRLEPISALVRAGVGAVVLATTGCATHLGATKARLAEPEYVVTQQFFTEAPQRVASLPFATRTGKSTDTHNAELCRRVFYQHMSLRDFEDMGLRKFDRSMFDSSATNSASRLQQLVDVVRLLDVVGMTTVLDLQGLFGSEHIPYPDFLEIVRISREQMLADAYIVGMTRSYGRFYAVVISSVGLSTRLEMRSAKTGSLLWRGQLRKRSFELPLTLNPLDIPRLLYDVWRNSRGLAMDSLAYQVYGDLSSTVPYVGRPAEVFVEVQRPYTPYFDEPTMWMLFPEGRANAGARFAFRIEQNGWYKCMTPDGEMVWIFRDHGRLVDQDGVPIDPRADLQW